MGATREVGQDFTNMLAQLSSSERSQAKIGVFTDPNVAKLPVMKVVEESLMREGLNWVLFDKISVEPTDKSWQVGLCGSLHQDLRLVEWLLTK
jgi:hydroxyacid-oxoacid transhydrogenase